MASRRTGRSTVECFTADRERIKAIAAQLTEDPGTPGRYDNPDAIRWVLDRVAELENQLEKIESRWDVQR
jgi:hypothetical protein